MNAFFKAISGTFAVAAIVAAMPANAHSDRKMRGHAMMPSFEELDANGDGSVSMEEAEARLNAMFAERDADGDGMLSSEEIKDAMMTFNANMPEKHIERFISRLDENEDGMISMEEIIAASRFERMFERLDEDEDGAISQEEFEEMKSKRGKGRKGHRKGKRGDSWHGKHDGGDKNSSDSD